MIVGCYQMHLYCDHGNDRPGFASQCKAFADITGPDEADCVKQAKARGWKFGTRSSKGFVFCKHH